ncbi:hypothetical protein ABPG75_002739 [Micractinium tetrahymenae]
MAHDLDDWQDVGAEEAGPSDAGGGTPTGQPGSSVGSETGSAAEAVEAQEEREEEGAEEQLLPAPAAVPEDPAQQMVQAAWRLANNPNVQAACFAALAADPEQRALLENLGSAGQLAPLLLEGPHPDGNAGGAAITAALLDLWARFQRALLRPGVLAAHSLKIGLQAMVQSMQTVVAGIGAGADATDGTAAACAAPAATGGHQVPMALHGAAWWPPGAVGADENDGPGPPLSRRQVLGLFLVIVAVFQILLAPRHSTRQACR